MATRKRIERDPDYDEQDRRPVREEYYDDRERVPYDERDRRDVAVAEEERAMHTRGDTALGEEEVATTHASPWYVARGWVRSLCGLIFVVLLAVETALGFRMGFAMANANPNNSFVDFIYDITGPLVSPFEGIVSHKSVGGGGVFEPETLIGMLVYAIAALLIIGLLLAVSSGPAATTGRSVVTRSRHARSVRDY